MPESRRADEGLVPVAVAPNEIIASLWQGMLEEAGIHSMAKATGPGMSYATNLANEHVIYVLASDAERARDILADETGDT